METVPVVYVRTIVENVVPVRVFEVIKYVRCENVISLRPKRRRFVR